MPFVDGLGPVDLLVSLSWRRIVAPQVLSRFRVARVNLHRGRLPGYEGPRPVERMLEDGCHDVVITAHEMIAEVDAGRTLAAIRLPVTRDPALTPAEQAEEVKDTLLVLYAPLLNVAIDSVVASLKAPGGRTDG